MPQRLLPVLTFSLIALFVLFAPVSHVRADAGKADTHTSIDGYTVELIFPDGQPQAGPNSVLVRLYDAADQPLSGAAVQLAAVAVQIAAAEEHGHAESGHADASAGPAAPSHTDANATGHADAAPADRSATHAANVAAPHPDGGSDGHGHAGDDQHVDIIMTQMEAGTEAGTYTSVLHFEAVGAWQVRLQFDAAGGDHAASFALTVAEPARDWRILAAFGGLNALIIAAAALMKPRFPENQNSARRTSTAVAEN